MPETPGPRTGQAGHIWSDVLAGLRLVGGQPVLRGIAVTGAVGNLFGYTQAAALVLYVTRDLALPAPAYGAILAGFGLGGMCGAIAGPRVAGRVGCGGAIACGAVLLACGYTLVALSGLPQPLFGLVAGQLLTGFRLPLCTISMVSLNQSIVPGAMLGRVNATARLVSWGALPLGALLGGVLGEAVGIRPTLVVSAIGSILVVAWVLSTVTPAARHVAGTTIMETTG